MQSVIATDLYILYTLAGFVSVGQRGRGREGERKRERERERERRERNFSSYYILY